MMFMIYLFFLAVYFHIYSAPPVASTGVVFSLLLIAEVLFWKGVKK